MRSLLRQMKWATQYGIWLGKRRERDRIIKLIRDTYTDHDFHETGLFVYSEDIVELIEKGNK